MSISLEETRGLLRWKTTQIQTETLERDVWICLGLKFSERLIIILINLFQYSHLSRSPEYFSTPTSLGRGRGGFALGVPADAEDGGLLWEGGGERKGSSGWKELPILISTSGPLSPN